MPAHQQTRILGPQFAPYWHRPWFRYIDAVPGAEAGTPPAASENQTDETLGFPKDTPLDQMTLEQREAYWKNQSKIQQKAREDAERAAEAYAKLGSLDELQAVARDAEQARLDALSANERAIEEARIAARAEGASQHLAAGVKGMLLALTRSANESFEDASKRVDDAIGFADLTKFIGDNGDLDAAKVQTFAQSIGSTGGNDPGSQEPWGARYERDHAGRIPPAPGASGSVASMQAAARERLNKKTA